MKFRSKIDWWFYTMPLAFIFLALYLFRFSTVLTSILGIIIMTIGALLIFPLFISTYYILTDTHLIVKSGFFYNTKIPYEEIISLRETKDAIASPGLSLDRIEICYASNEVIQISPQNKDRFLYLLDEQIS